MAKASYTKAQLTKFLSLIQDYGEDLFVTNATSQYRKYASVQTWLRRARAMLERRKGKQDDGPVMEFRQAVFLDFANALEKTPEQVAAQIGFPYHSNSQSRNDPVCLKSRRRLSEIFQSGEFLDKPFMAWLQKKSEEEIRNLPGFIHRAIASLHGAWESGTAVRPKDSERVLWATTDKSHPEFKDAQRNLARQIKKMWPRAEPSAPSDDFGAMTSPETGMFYPEMYLFPFTMGKTRRSLFGVLPFARQKQIGFVMSKRHDAYQWLQKHYSGPMEPVSRPVKEGNRERQVKYLLMKELSVEWFAKIVTTTKDRGGRIFSAVGDVQSLMLMEALHYQKEYLEANKGLGMLQDKPSRYGGELDKCFSGANLRDRSVFVFDPWEWRRLELKRGFAAIICPHGIDVEIGVGFSLNLLPQLLVQDRWREILREARHAYGKRFRKLEEIGIEMLPEDA